MTMKAISDLLAKEGTHIQEVAKAATQPQGTVVPKRSILKQPQPIRVQDVLKPKPSKAAALPPIAPVEPQRGEPVSSSFKKPWSFLSRLIGK